MTRLALVALLLVGSVARAQIGGSAPIGGGGGGSGGGFVLTSSVSPAQLTTTGGTSGGASYDDYAGCLGAHHCRLTSNGSVTIDGFTAAANAWGMEVCNVGSNSITLAHQNTGSAAANRILNGLGTSTGANILVAGQCSMLVYDATTARHYIVATTSPNGLATTGGNTFTGTQTFDDGASGPATSFTTGTNVPLKISLGGTGQFQVVKAAESGTAETVFKFSVGDDSTGKMELRNNSATDATFVPRLHFTGPGTNQAVVLLGDITTDTGTNAAIALQCTKTGATQALGTRPCLDIFNFATLLFDMDASGNISVASGATATKGSKVLSGGTGTVTVKSGAKCVCSLEVSAGTAAPKCSVSSTTLTVTGTGTDTISYICL